MRLYDLAYIAELNRLESDHVLTCLFQVDIPGAPLPLRLANYAVPIVFHGLVYEPWPVNVDSVEDATSSSMTHLRISPQNVNQEIIALFETYWYANQDWRVTMWEIDAMQPDVTNFESGNVYSLMSSPTDLLVGTFDLVAEGMTLNTLLPKRRYTTTSGFSNIPRR
jgi:hypothetical protein